MSFLRNPLLLLGVNLSAIAGSTYLLRSHHIYNLEEHEARMDELEGTLRGHIGLIEEALDRLEGKGTEADRNKKMYAPVVRSLPTDTDQGLGTSITANVAVTKRTNNLTYSGNLEAYQSPTQGGKYTSCPTWPSPSLREGEEMRIRVDAVLTVHRRIVLLLARQCMSPIHSEDLLLLDPKGSVSQMPIARSRN